MSEEKTYIEGAEYSEQTARLDRQTERANRASQKITRLREKIEKHRRSRAAEKNGCESNGT